MGQFPVADDAVDLEMLERAWVDALNRRDASVVSRIIAEDFAGIDSAGSGFTKASYLLDVCNGAFPAEPIVQDEVKIRLFGDSAVVTSRIKLQTGPRWNGSTNVYVKRQGRWCCVASQMLWIGAAKTLQPSLLTKGQEETHLANEEQLLKQLLVLQEKLAIAEMQNAHLRENSKKERASVQSNHPEGARSPNAAEPTTEQRQAIEELLLTRNVAPLPRCRPMRSRHQLRGIRTFMSLINPTRFKGSARSRSRSAHALSAWSKRSTSRLARPSRKAPP